METTVIKEKEQSIYLALDILGKEKSFHELTVAEIARAANIGKGTIYEYFNTKEDILKGYFDYVINQYYQQMQAFANDEHNAIDTLWHMVDYEQKTSCDYHSRLALLTHHGEFMSSVKELVSHYYRNRYFLFASIVEQAIKNGEFANQSVEQAAVLFVGTMSGGYMMSKHNSEFQLRQLFDYTIKKLK